MNLQSVEKINSLKQGVEAVTGETYNDLTEAVQDLKDGYGQGEGEAVSPLLEISVIQDDITLDNDNIEIAFTADKDLLSGDGAYPLNSEDINAVIIPEGSTYLSATAFDTLPNIKALYFNSECEVETVGIADSKGYTRQVNALLVMPNLKKVVFGGDVKNIPDNFLDSNVCQSPLETVIIGDEVETIGEWAFYNCVNVENLRIGNNVKTIGNYAFYNLSNVIGTLIIPDSVTELKSDGHGYCNTFYGMRNITGVVIGKGLTKIGASVFAECGCLTEVVIPSNIKTIGDFAFSGCSNLKKTVIEEGVETIKSSAFAWISNVNFDVYIPRSVTSIAPDAFMGSWITIHGYAGSYAETYATENGFNFEVIEE